MFELFGTDIEFTVSMSLDPWVSILHLLDGKGAWRWVGGSKNFDVRFLLTGMRRSRKFSRGGGGGFEG